MRYRSRFLGREEELTAIRTASESGRRLLSLVGPPGIGKTRLAIEAVKSLDRHVAICELESARDTESICDALMRALDIPPRYSGHRGTSEIGAWLAQRGSLVVVLDNLEQIVGPISELLQRWMQKARQTFFLATSQRALNIGEALQLQPLTGDGIATELFVQRAPEFQRPELRDRTSQTLIAHLVRQLGGNPLAIELAAARLELLTLEQLQTSITKALAQVRDPIRRGRHASLAEAIHWSWDLLPRWGQSALSQMSVFRGGFTLSAAQAVVTLEADQVDEAHGTSEATVLDAVHALVRHSLLWRTGWSSHSRFRVPVSVREFAAAEMSADRRIAANVRHLSHYLQLPNSTSTHDRTIRDTEHDNLTVAFRRLEKESPSVRRSEDLLGLVVLLSHRLHRTGAHDENLRLLNLAIAQTHPDVEPELLANALSRRTRVFRYTNKLETAKDDALRALALLPETGGDPLFQAWLKTQLAEIYSLRYQFDDQAALLTDALAAFEAVGEVRGQATCLHHTALRAVRRGEFAQAEDLAQRALGFIRQTGDRQFEGHILHVLGVIASDSDRLEEAQKHWTLALNVFTAINDPRNVGLSRGYLAIFAHHQGDLAAARAGYREVVRIAEDFNEFRLAGWYSTYLGLLDLEVGALGNARDHLERALRRFGQAADVRYEGIANSALAAIALARGQSQPDGLLDRAEALLRSSREPQIEPILRVYRAWARLSTTDLSIDDVLPDWRQLKTTTSDDVRLALRAVDTEIERRANSDVTVRIQRAGLYFERPGHDRVSLDRRQSLAGILSLLAHRRLREPGKTVSLKELIGAGWPQTQIKQKSGANRAYVALSTLRKLGLGDLIQRRDDGYLLALDQHCQVVD